VVRLIFLFILLSISTLQGQPLVLPDTVLPALQPHVLHKNEVIAAMQAAERTYFQRGQDPIPQLTAQLHIAANTNNPELVSMLLTHIGFFHFEQGNYPMGEAYIQQAKDLAIEHGLKESEIRAVVTLGYAEMRQKRYDQAYPAFSEAVQLNEKSFKIPGNLLKVYSTAALIAKHRDTGALHWAFLLFTYGGLSFLVVYLWVVYARVRYRPFLHYGLALTFGLVYLMFLYRTGGLLFQMRERHEMLLSLISSIAALYFYDKVAFEFLGTHPTRYPWKRVNQFLMAAMALTLIPVVINVLFRYVPTQGWMGLIHLLQFLVLLNILFVTLLRWNFAERDYRGFLRGQVAFIVFMILFFMGNLMFGLFTIPFLTENSVKLAFFTQGLFFSLALSGRLESLNRERNEALLEVREKAVAEELLLGILPQKIVSELSTTGKAQPQMFEHAVVLFTDFEGFTNTTRTMDPADVIAWLDDFFLGYDRAVEAHGLTRIKTIGDAYMAAAGVPEPMEQPEEHAIQAALDILAHTREVNRRWQPKTGAILPIKIGLHGGPLVAGIVGHKHYHYDIWGETVNMAARMQQSASGSEILISNALYERLTPETQLRFAQNREVAIKGYQQPQKAHVLSYPLGAS
jgi:class 3 adenylate cyclase